ncbi:ankyrin repeat-containing protein ITN1-like isoform X2 [Vitis riparia]|uniref:ankyrin repeat-containing protein ITN1-like isoform X2 n=1 Tax=Vitis riparia TaxID=96939 RepID=UPI00155A2DC8|nr:ankyrin repeat-containing protein ITN1-like isoform X2 [Vitis riparia]
MDLAFQIICKQEDLMDAVDSDGFSPLHVLAEKPTAFRSGIHLSWFNKIIYHCISVEELIPAGTSKAKKNFFQELRKLIKLPGKSKKHLDPENPEEGQGIEHHGHNSTNIGAQGHKPFHSKYGRCLRFIKLFVSQVLLVIISVMPGSSQVRKLKEKKEMHMWSLQILNKLHERAARCTYEMNPKNHEAGSEYEYLIRERDRGMTPILLASRNGIVEMVEKILQLFPMAIHDTNGCNWNIVLEAVENRQSHIYEFLLNSSHLIDKEGAFHAVDYHRNNALHLAGKLANYRYLQRIPTSMLQMQWEVKWYQYVQNSLPPYFVVQKNDRGDTPDEIFQMEHQRLEDASKQWLNSTSNSCSFIAALIATVAFASSASVPGGVKQDTGEPVFENHLAFSIFAMASLVALCCSVISLLIFLAIFISKDQDKDFTTNLPRNFLFGLTSLFISMTAMLTCFCSGNFLMLKGQLKYAAILVYALTGLLMAYFVLKHFPLFIDLLKATFRKVPERIYKEYL